MTGDYHGDPPTLKLLVGCHTRMRANQVALGGLPEDSVGDQLKAISISNLKRLSHAIHCSLFVSKQERESALKPAA